MRREKEKKAFEAAKALLMSPNLLVHYDFNRELVLTCDASEYGQYYHTKWKTAPNVLSDTHPGL